MVVTLTVALDSEQVVVISHLSKKRGELIAPFNLSGQLLSCENLFVKTGTGSLVPAAGCVGLACWLVTVIRAAVGWLAGRVCTAGDSISTVYEPVTVIIDTITAA